MVGKIDDLLPSASAIRMKMAQAEGNKAAEDSRRQAKAEEEKAALLDRLAKPSGVSDEERMKRAAAIIDRAVRNGLTEVEIGRFPNRLCTDRGRAINQQEPGWETTLTGLPMEVFQFWKIHLQPRGYRLKCQVADYSTGVPGDIAITLSWDE